MAAQGRNQGFHVLDEFVCEAIHAPSISRADPAKQGRNQGMSVVEELTFDAAKEPTAAGLDDVIKSQAEQLAVIISTSADPIGKVAQFQKLLLDELATIQRSGLEHLKQSHESDAGSGKPA